MPGFLEPKEDSPADSPPAPAPAPKAVPVQRAAAKAKEHGWQLKFMVIICY